MSSILRFRKLCYVEPVNFESFQKPENKNKDDQNKHINNERKGPRKQGKEWKCIDNCCWVIGYLITTWWVLLFLFNSYSANLPGLRVVESPGTRLKREGVMGYHPVVLVPGIVTGGLELWEGKPCSEGLFRKRVWGGSFGEIFKRPLCWLEHLSLDNESGLDPPGIRVRAVPGLVAADYFAPGYFVWAVLIENLARIGYEGKNMYMASYDWRLSFQNTEIRDQTLSRLKSKIELMYVTNGNKKVVVVPHSMGTLYFLHFMKWVEAPTPMGGGGGPRWCDKHIKAIMNIGPTFLGVPKAASNILSAEAKDVAFIRVVQGFITTYGSWIRQLETVSLKTGTRAMAPGLLDSELLGLQTLEHVMRVSRTWDSIISLMPKGGETIWGDSDWSPEEGLSCNLAIPSRKVDTNNTDGRISLEIKEFSKYGRIVSFGKASSQLPSSQLPNIASKELLRGSSATNSNTSCKEYMTEYDEMSRESIRKVAEKKAYTAQSLTDMFRFIAPKMMKRAEAHFSHGIADNLDDPKYNHYKYWSNPLETKLPDAPNMQIHCLYGVGIPTERSYVYKLSPSDKCGTIPFQIDSSADGSNDKCLRGGVYFSDGDESVPTLSAGFMCAKGWRGKTRFNPSGISTYVREYMHKPPSSILEGRGLESGAHVDIMGNVGLIKDVLRVASGEEIGRDRIYSDIMRMSERINIRL